eukprot:scaffold2678_cov123-Skeletonema_dohrnii-CCMP3373.AAC.4
MVRLVKVEKENVTSDGDGGILSLANNIRNRVMNALPANASANKVPQDVLKSTVGVFSTAVTLDDEFEEFEKETDAKAQQFLVEQNKQASHNICGVQTTDAGHNSIHNILRKLQRSVNRIEDNQKALQDDLKALKVQVQARQSQRRHSPADIDALAEAVVAKLQTNG